MKLILIVLITLITSNLFSQNDWTKTDRNNLYEDLVSEISKYKMLSQEQKESIGLCCLETISSKYSKTEYSNKIDIELKRIKESSIDQCAKNIGLQLKVEETPIESQPTVEVQPTAQINDDLWTKDDKSNLIKDVFKILESYENLTEENKEIVALCVMDKTCEDITKTQYENMISLELNRYTVANIEKCAKLKTIDLNNTPIIETEVNVLNRKSIIGTWKTDQNMTIIFNDDGTFLKTYNDIFTIAERFTNIENSTVTGDWFLDENGNLTLSENWIELDYKLLSTKRYSYSETGIYSFISFSEDYFKMSFISGVYCCQDYNGARLKIMQATRIK